MISIVNYLFEVKNYEKIREASKQGTIDGAKHIGKQGAKVAGIAALVSAGWLAKNKIIEQFKDPVR